MTIKIYDLDETAILFADSAQAEDVTITLSALGAGAGRISAQHDRGAGAKATKLRITLCFQLASAGTLNEGTELYIATSDGTNVDGTVGTVDAALTSDKCKNLIPVGVVLTDTTSTNTDISATFEITITARYFSIGVFNRTTDAFRTDTSVHHIRVIPVCKQLQNAA